MKGRLLFSFESFRGLLEGSKSVKAVSAFLLIASFFLGSFVTSAILSTNDKAYEFVGGLIAALLKLLA